MAPVIRGTAPSPLGDCLRAVAALAPSDAATVRAIVAALGVEARSAVARPVPAVPAASRDDGPDAEDDEPVHAAPPPRSVDDDADLPPLRDATLVARGEHAQPAPDWLQRVALLPTSDRVSNPFRGAVAPLFEPKWQRAIVTGLSAAWEPGGTIDLDRVILEIAMARPLRSVPRQPIRSARRGVLVLIDQGESMQPFRRDVTQLVRAFRRTIGVSRLRVQGFRGLPGWGVTEGLDWRPFAARPDATPVVLITDLGLAPQPDSAGPAAPDDWRRFLGAQASKGLRATVVVPRAAASLPVAWSRHVALVAWDRRTRVSRLGSMGGEGTGAAIEGEVDDDAAITDVASACALAVRIEPSLLRELRLAVAPDAGVELEAAVWFSPLVADRASTGIVLADETREALLLRLRDRPLLCALAREIVARAHEEAPAAVRLEEEATWRWVIGETERARDILRRMVATVVSPDRGDAWRWAARAVERLPPALMAIDEGQMLALGTAVRSGEPAPLRSVRPTTGRDWRWLRSTTRETVLAVTLRRGAIEFGPATAKSPTTMRVPDVNPLWIDIVPDGREDHAQRVRINPLRRVLVSIEGDRFELEAIGGERHRLEVVRRPEPGNAQKFIVRNAAPHVRIEYQIEWYGATRSIELPFVVGVMAELSGTSGAGTPTLAERRFVDIDVDNFDERLKQIAPRVAVTVAGPDDLAVDLTFGSLADFAPAAVARRVPPLAALLEERGDLLDLLAYLDGRTEAEAIVEALLDDPGSLDDDPTEASSAVADTPSLHGLQRALRPRTDAAWQRVVGTLRTASSRLAGSPDLYGHDALESLQNLVADLDARLTAPVNGILHHPDFQRLESAWRGLFFLVSRTDTGENLRIRVLDLPRRELVRTMRRHAGDRWDQSPLFKKIHEEAFGVFGGTPYGCLIGDYAFDQRDVDTLTGLARIAAASQAPLLAAAGPGLLQMDSWRQLGERRDLAAIFATPEYAPWASLRADEDSRWIGLTMPRFLARPPYGSAHDPVDEFAFEEEGGPDSDRLVWANAAYALGTNITRAFKQYGWCARIRGYESGGAVTGLPTLRYPGYDGSAPFDTGVETPISDRREAELARSGLMPFIARRGGDGAYFLGTQTLMRPSTYDDADASSNATLSGRLPFLFAIGRFSHYIKCIARDRIGSAFDVDSMERTLQAWLTNYVDPEPAQSSEGARAAKPLAQARVLVELVDDRPGAYRATLFLQPHYQLEGLTTSLRVVTLLFVDPQASDAAASAS